LLPIDGQASLTALYEEHRALVLVTRGYPTAASSAALGAFESALAALGREAPRAYLVDGSSEQVSALTFLETLGLSSADPYVVIVEDFKRTRRKYLMAGAGVPGALAIEKFVRRQGAGGVPPALLGQVRPANDTDPAFPALTRVVSSSFSDLVLDPSTPTLLLVHRRTCDACKAFAPRYRMLAQLAAHHLPSLRVACIDAGDNDIDFEHVPESWTPVLRFFPACSAGGSVLLDTRVGGQENKIHLPTLPDLLKFIAQHSSGAVPALSPALLEEAVALEEEAAALEAAFDNLLNYLQLWKAFTEVSGGLEGEQQGEASRAASALKASILEAYNFIVKRAARGGAEEAWRRLDKIASLVERSGISRAVSQAATLEHKKESV